MVRHVHIQLAWLLLGGNSAMMACIMTQEPQHHLAFVNAMEELCRLLIQGNNLVASVERTCLALDVTDSPICFLLLSLHLMLLPCNRATYADLAWLTWAMSWQGHNAVASNPGGSDAAARQYQAMSVMSLCQVAEWGVATGHA